MKLDPNFMDNSLDICSNSFHITTLLLHASPPLEVDSENIRELILFVKETLTVMLTNISTIDNLIASLRSDSSPTTSLVSGDDKRMADSLTIMRDQCEEVLSSGWVFFVRVTFQITDDSSFPEFVVHLLKLSDKGIRENTIKSVASIVLTFPWMKEKVMAANLVGRMFEIVDFVSLPLSESYTHFALTTFLVTMLTPIGDDLEAVLEQSPLVRVSVFEPAKHFITFMFNNSDKLFLVEKDKSLLDIQLAVVHSVLKYMELRSDEHDTDIVSGLLKWETRAVVEMENEKHFELVFKGMLNTTLEWRQTNPERQKRREVLSREEGWDDTLELRVVGIDVNTSEDLVDLAVGFRIVQTFNSVEL
ncbi:hypothetical protein BLNAU_9086 [Blattamonas nauphoetae]|uniref:Uncharacterized protein n=1 Tax=Blattamonas nauphoetae TaxID=2049346 RepID=A0ABQ9XWS4_9EUKA|nr:hypothetical protein BLNAU_9086 [Blattamonas nauphoetae]